MDQARKLVIVSACALIDKNNRILMAERPEGKSLAGMWEFPGGKLEANETLEQCLQRELYEELDIEIAIEDLAPLTFASHRYEAFDLLMPLYLCQHYKGTITAKEGQKFAWIPLEDMDKLPLPPADIPLVSFIQQALPSILATKE